MIYIEVVLCFFDLVLIFLFLIISMVGRFLTFVMMLTISIGARGMLLCETGTCKEDADGLKVMTGNVGSYSAVLSGYPWGWLNIPGGATASGGSRCSDSSSSPYGANNGFCWCRVEVINGKSCVGSWVYLSGNGYYPSECIRNCSTACGLCVWRGSDYSCTRAQLFAF